MENGQKGAKSGEGRAGERFTPLSRRLMVVWAGGGGLESRPVGDLFQRWNPQDMSLRWEEGKQRIKPDPLGGLGIKTQKGKAGSRSGLLESELPARSPGALVGDPRTQK